MNTEFHTPFEWFMQMYMFYKISMEGTYDIPNKNPHFFQPNRVGFSPKWW